MAEVFVSMFNFLQTRPSSQSTTLAKSALDGLLMNGLRKHNSGWGLEHNSFDKRGGPVLFGYSCDLSRIGRYSDTPKKREMKDTLICFDFQTLALERLCAGNVVFQWLGSSAVEEAIFDQQEKLIRNLVSRLCLCILGAGQRGKDSVNRFIGEIKGVLHHAVLVVEGDIALILFQMQDCFVKFHIAAVPPCHLFSLS